MSQHHNVGSILISLFLGTWGTISLELHPRDEGSHIHWGWENTRSSARSKHYPDWKIRKWKCMRNENAWGSRPKLSNEKIKFLICNLLGEESSLLCYGNKRLLHGSCFLIRAWVDEGLPEASWLQRREWSVSRGWSETWCWPQMQWLYYYDMCRVTWGCHQWRFQLFLLYPELQLLGQLVFGAS